MPDNQTLSQLKRRFERLSRIDDALGILHWDQAVNLPSGSSEARADQLAELSQLSHEILVATEIGSLIENALADASVAGIERTNVELMKRSYVRATALEPDFVARKARVCSLAELAWRSARAENNFAAFKPNLREVLDIARTEAKAYSAKLYLKPYDALLDQFQPGLRESSFIDLFDVLERELPDRVEQAIANNLPFQGQQKAISATEQAEAFKTVMGRVGFDFTKGRLDQSTHPFCGGASGDHRITSRYDEMDVSKGLMGVLHETGHALYEMGLPTEWRGQPVGESLGIVVHESQSLLTEMQLCRSPAFLSYLSGMLASAFGQDPAWETKNLIAQSTHVSRQPIRVDADEVTYPLHVILRYRLERALFDDDLSVDDLPAAWHDMARNMLGIDVATDREGCLQDIHWPEGIFGYFPCYTLGALLAAQLFDKLKEAIVDLNRQIASGDFAEAISWLRSTIHQRGSTLGYDTMVKSSTDNELGPHAFLAHIDRRYIDRIEE